MHSNEETFSMWHIPWRIWILAAIVFVIALILRWLVLFFGNSLIYDDAYITMRIVRNLANSYGFVYNVGERIQSTSSPLYVLLWSGLWKLVGEQSVFVIRLLGGIADAATAFWIVIMVSGVSNFISGRNLFNISQDNSATGYLPVINMAGAAFSGVFYAGVSTCSLVAIMGMETGFYTLIIIMTFWSLAIRRYFLASALSGIAMLLRPDGVLLALAVLVVVAFYNRRIPIKELLIMALILAPYEIFALYYYGTIIPQTVIAKSLVYRSASVEWMLFLNKFFIGGPKAWVVGAACLVGLAVILRGYKYLLPVILWSICYSSCFSTFAVWWPWYFPPAMIGYSIAFGIGFGVIIDRLSASFSARVKVNFVRLLVLTGLLAALSVQTLNYTKSHQNAGLRRQRK